jgi:translation initiation factor eIF-2B subunit alpha
MAAPRSSKYPPEPPNVEYHTEQISSIVSIYHSHLQHDRLLTHPIAAIEALITLLSASPPSTISETLQTLASYTATLKDSVANPIALSAGTDLFQRYIISTLQQRSSLEAKRKRSSSSSGAEDFRAIRAHLLANSRLFVQRAKEARGKIAEVAKRFVKDGSTVLTCGRSRVVAAVLNAAADSGVRFQVIYAEDGLVPADVTRATDVVGGLRSMDVPVARIPFAALATVLSQTTFVLAGAESVVENGGIISSMGTYQMGLLAKSAGKPFYVVAESHKFVRLYPLSGTDLPIEQNVLEFETETEGGKQEQGKRKERCEAVDFTPPDLITAIVTESGVSTPSSVSEELIKIWY